MSLPAGFRLCDCPHGDVVRELLFVLTHDPDVLSRFINGASFAPRGDAVPRDVHQWAEYLFRVDNQNTLPNSLRAFLWALDISGRFGDRARGWK